MHKLAFNSGGLGDSTPDLLLSTTAPALTSAPWANACGSSFLAYASNFNCWGQPYGDWENAYSNFTTINIPAPAALGVPSTALSNPDAVLADTTGATGQAISNEQLGQSESAIAAANPSVGTQLSAGLAPFYCNFLDCDDNGNLQMDANNLAWLIGGAAALYVLAKLL